MTADRLATKIKPVPIAPEEAASCRECALCS